MSYWYLVTNNKSEGPLTPDEIVNRIRASQVNPQTLAYTQGMSDWTLLASFCRETLQVERVLLRTLIERATERAFHPSYHLTPTGGAGKKASFATETS